VCEEHGAHGDELPDVREILVRVEEEELEEGQDGAVHVLHQALAPVQQIVEDGKALLSASLNRFETWLISLHFFFNFLTRVSDPNPYSPSRRIRIQQLRDPRVQISFNFEEKSQ